MPPMKSLFWLEDNADELLDYRKALGKKYDVESGAHWGLIKRPRQRPIDLVIVDLMIHHFSFDEETNQEVENVQFPDAEWIESGLEFLRRLRAGEYQMYGFPPDVPAIVATAVATYPAREQAERLDIEAFLEKPFTIKTLEAAVDGVFCPSEEREQ